jgi:hypothetical protein
MIEEAFGIRVFIGVYGVIYIEEIAVFKQLVIHIP